MFVCVWEYVSINMAVFVSLFWFGYYLVSGIRRSQNCLLWRHRVSLHFCSIDILLCRIPSTMSWRKQESVLPLPLHRHVPKAKTLLLFSHMQERCPQHPWLLSMQRFKPLLIKTWSIWYRFFFILYWWRALFWSVALFFSFFMFFLDGINVLLCLCMCKFLSVNRCSIFGLFMAYIHIDNNNLFDLQVFGYTVIWHRIYL